MHVTIIVAYLQLSYLLIYANVMLHIALNVKLLNTLTSSLIKLK